MQLKPWPRWLIMLLPLLTLVAADVKHLPKKYVPMDQKPAAARSQAVEPVDDMMDQMAQTKMQAMADGGFYPGQGVPLPPGYALPSSGNLPTLPNGPPNFPLPIYPPYFGFGGMPGGFNGFGPGQGGPGFPSAQLQGGPGFPNGQLQSGPGFPNAQLQGGPGFPNAQLQGGPGFPNGPQLQGGPGFPNGPQLQGGPGFPNGPQLQGGPGFPNGPQFQGGPGFPNGPQLQGGPGFPNGPQLQGGPGFPNAQGGGFPPNFPGPGFPQPGPLPGPGFGMPPGYANFGAPPPQFQGPFGPQFDEPQAAAPTTEPSTTSAPRLSDTIYGSNGGYVYKRAK